MRRSDRQVTDLDGIRAILDSSDVCTLALNDADGTPYAVPVNYGYTLDDGGVLKLYFHGARTGKKVELMRRDGRVAFSVCAPSQAYCEQTGDAGQACTWSARYASVTGQGTVRELTDDGEKRAALEQLMLRVTGRTGYAYAPDVLSRTGVFVIEALRYSGKRNEGKAEE